MLSSDSSLKRDSPTVNCYPEYVVDEEKSVTLKCLSDAFPPAFEYTWSRDNASGIELQRGSNSSLYISKVQSVDGSLYVSSATNIMSDSNRTSRKGSAHCQVKVTIKTMADTSDTDDTKPSDAIYIVIGILIIIVIALGAYISVTAFKKSHMKYKDREELDSTRQCLTELDEDTL